MLPRSQDAALDDQPARACWQNGSLTFFQFRRLDGLTIKWIKSFKLHRLTRLQFKPSLSYANGNADEAILFAASRVPKTPIAACGDFRPIAIRLSAGKNRKGRFLLAAIITLPVWQIAGENFLQMT